jgi:hypothetical protein
MACFHTNAVCACSTVTCATARADALAAPPTCTSVNPGGSVGILDLAANGPALAVGLSDGSVHVYSAAKQMLLYTSSVRMTCGPIMAVANSTQQNSVVAVAANGVREILGGGSSVHMKMCDYCGVHFLDIVRIRSIHCMHNLPQYRFTEYLRSYVLLHRYADPKGSDVYCAAASPDGKLLAVGGEGRLLLFDAKTKQLVSVFEDTHKEAVSQVCGLHGDRDLISMCCLTSSLHFARCVSETQRDLR